MIPALMAKNRLEDAKSIARKLTGYVSRGSFNWHIALIQRISVCFYTKEFEEAFDLYKIERETIYRFQGLNEFWSVINGC